MEKWIGLCVMCVGRYGWGRDWVDRLYMGRWMGGGWMDYMWVDGWVVGGWIIWVDGWVVGGWIICG